MPRYKRTALDAELDVPVERQLAPEDVTTLTELRNMWEFASLMQYIFLFGHVVKIDEDFDIEDLEAECIKPTPSERLSRIGLALLKYVSSHRGLTPDIFDEYTRRQYEAKAPSRNPYGDSEEPTKFADMDIFTRIRVLHQLSTWTFGNADRIRGMMAQEEDHLSWRMEPLGWDKDDRSYFVLDDNRLYRRSDVPLSPPTPPPKPKAKSKSKSKKSSKSKATRSSKRRKTDEMEEEDLEELDGDAEGGAQDDTVMTVGEEANADDEEGYGFTARTWDCMAITLDEYNDFLASIFRSRDPNEKLLRKRIEEDVVPVIEKRVEALQAKHLKKLREIEVLQKMTTAKRSSRLAGKAEKDKEERDKREAEEKKQRDLRMAHEEDDRQKRIEEGHESRRLTREQRLKEREVKRILHEEELQKLQEQEERAVSQDPNADAAAAAEAKRVSARQTQTQKEQHRKQLEELAQEDGKWYFDCSICGMNGENLDDGSHSVACDRCGVWQHSKCHGFSPKQAEKGGFTFICSSCKRKEADDKRPKIPTLKLGKKATSGSPDVTKNDSRPSTGAATATPSAPPNSGLPPHVQRQLDGVFVPSGHPRPSPGPFGQITNGPSLSPHGQASGPPGYRYPPVGNFAPHPPQQVWNGSPFPPPNRPPSSGYASSPPPPIGNGHGAPPHHQQHQYAHQSAVATAGGHPPYQPPPQYQQQPNGYGQHTPTGQYSASQPQHAHYPAANSYLQHQHQRPPLPDQQRRPSLGYQAPPQYNQQQPPGPGRLMNGFHSPTKTSVQPAGPSTHQTYAQTPSAPQQSSPVLQRSPSASFPPPTINYAHQRSPIKSSPPHHPQQAHHLALQSSPALMATPGTLRPLSANGYHPAAFQTPQGQTQPASAMANGVVADGMAGPWPEGSKAIPQKHDQSPAPPSSAISETKVMPPPVGTLAPSPSQQAIGQPGNIPVKKMLTHELNGTPVSSQQ
ncbi:hypothetical protein LTR08_006920 [Meristemomyces frigidus]|nr:hypothetical protein LTR08_006920 [Meristemomyces frigidus]